MSTVNLSSGFHFDQTPFGRVDYGFNYMGDYIVAFHGIAGNYFMNYCNRSVMKSVLEPRAKAIFKIKKRK